MIKRPSIKGKGKKILFEEAAKSIEEEQLKEESVLEEDEKVKVKKEIEVKKKVGKREGVKEKTEEVETTKEITFEEKHPLLTKEPFIKTTVMLSNEENEFLHSLGIKAKLSGGDKLPKSIIIRGFVKAFMDVKLNVDGLKKDDDKILFERVRGFIKK